MDNLVTAVDFDRAMDNKVTLAQDGWPVFLAELNAVRTAISEGHQKLQELLEGKTARGAGPEKDIPSRFDAYCPDYVGRNGKLTERGEALANRKTITTAELRNELALDPAWASKLAEDIEVTDYADLSSDNNLTHLSHHLYFSGRNPAGWVAEIYGCPNLEEASGNFLGHVSFNRSGMKTIGEIHVAAPSTSNWAASFYACKDLAEARGHYNGYADFTLSGIKKIRDLVTTGVTTKVVGDVPVGLTARFISCERLTNGPAYLLKPEYGIDNSLRETIRAKNGLSKSNQTLEVEM